MKVKITNMGEGSAEIIYEVTEIQFLLLQDIFSKLNSDNSDSYSPSIIIERLK